MIPGGAGHEGHPNEPLSPGLWRAQTKVMRRFNALYPAEADDNPRFKDDELLRGYDKDRDMEMLIARVAVRLKCLQGMDEDPEALGIAHRMQQVLQFLKGTQYYFLATTDGDQPQVRPFGTAEIIEGKLYIQTGHVKNVAKQIAANPKVAICAYNGQEWLRITATLVEDPRIEIKKQMLDANPGLRSMYNENDDNTAVFFLTDAKATISSFVAAPVEIEF